MVQDSDLIHDLVDFVEFVFLFKIGRTNRMYIKRVVVRVISKIKKYSHNPKILCNFTLSLVSCTELNFPEAV